MNVHWTDLAVKHLADIHEYIARTSPQYALRMVDRLTRRSQQIGSFPQSADLFLERMIRISARYSRDRTELFIASRRTRLMLWP